MDRYEPVMKKKQKGNEKATKEFYFEREERRGRVKGEGTDDQRERKENKGFERSKQLPSTSNQRGSRRQLEDGKGHEEEGKEETTEEGDGKRERASM